MGTVTHRGSAKPDDPIYTGGPQVYFRSPLPKPASTPAKGTANAPDVTKSTTTVMPVRPVQSRK